MTVKKCSDPSKEIREKLTEMKQTGCQFAPVTHSGNRYRSRWICPVRGGSLTITQVITVKGADRYEDSNESH